MRINNNNTSFGALNLSSVAKPLEAFYNPNATAPIFTIESGVTIGRSIQAKKRGGIKEATDRFIEQGVSAAIWIWGVQALKKTGEFFGEKILKQSLDFDIGFDELRNPVKNNNISKSACAYKMGNLLLSTALATYFIGFALPKISMNIAKKRTKENSKKENSIKPLGFSEFQNRTKSCGAKKQPSFTSLYNGVRSFSSLIENNSTARLFITDTGVIAGRCKNAKSKYRKIENLFRDISSIYFYLFSTGHIVKALDKATSTVDINPKILSETTKMLKEELGDRKISSAEFLEFAFGKNDSDALSALDNLFKDKKVIDVEEFSKIFPHCKEKALEMSKLQPLYSGKAILSKNQAVDVLKNGRVNNPKFLNSAISFALDGKNSDAKRFISSKEIDNMRKSIDDFILMLSKTSETIDAETVYKKANANIKKSFGFYAFATAVSIYALGVLIPKIQYAISRKLTNKDEFRE